jgi:hypothetical protein
MLRVQHEQHVLSHEVTAVDVAMSRDRNGVVFDADNQVDRLRPQVVERRRGLALDNFDLKVRRRLAKPVQDPGQEGESRCLDERHPEAAARCIARARELAAHGFVGCERLGGIGGQAAAGGGQLDVPARTAEQLRPGLAFELSELDRDGRRAVGQGLRDRRDRSEARQLVEEA